MDCYALVYIWPALYTFKMQLKVLEIVHQPRTYSTSTAILMHRRKWREPIFWLCQLRWRSAGLAALSWPLPPSSPSLSLSSTYSSPSLSSSSSSLSWPLPPSFALFNSSSAILDAYGKFRKSWNNASNGDIFKHEEHNYKSWNYHSQQAMEMYIGGFPYTCSDWPWPMLTTDWLVDIYLPAPSFSISWFPQFL